METIATQDKKEQEFKIQESSVNGTVIYINGNRGEKYNSFYKEMEESDDCLLDENLPKEFISIFEPFIKQCGLNLVPGAEPAIENPVHIRCATSYLNTVSKFSIWPELDFQCQPGEITILCKFAITGADKEKIKKLLRLALIINYPDIIELIPAANNFYKINLIDYCRIKTNLYLLNMLITQTNEIVLELAEKICMIVNNLETEDVKYLLKNLKL